MSPSLRWQDDKTSVLFGFRYTNQQFEPGAFTFADSRVKTGTYATVFDAPRQPVGSPYAFQKNAVVTAYSEISRKLGSIAGYEFAVHTNNAFSQSYIDQNGYYLGLTRGPNIFVVPQDEYYKYYTFDSKNDLTIKKDFGFARELVRFGLDYQTFYSRFSQGLDYNPWRLEAAVSSIS